MLDFVIYSIEIINCFSLIQKQIYENNDINNDKNKILEITDYHIIYQIKKK